MAVEKFRNAPVAGPAHLTDKARFQWLPSNGHLYQRLWEADRSSWNPKFS